MAASSPFVTKTSLGGKGNLVRRTIKVTKGKPEAWTGPGDFPWLAARDVRELLGAGNDLKSIPDRTISDRAKKWSNATRSDGGQEQNATDRLVYDLQQWCRQQRLRLAPGGVSPETQ